MMRTLYSVILGLALLSYTTGDAYAGFLSNCLYTLSKNNLNGTLDGITAAELKEAHSTLFETKFGRPGAKQLLDGPDPSDVVVATALGELPLKKVLADNRGLLLLLKEIPEAIPYWETLNAFPR